MPETPLTYSILMGLVNDLVVKHEALTLAVLQIVAALRGQPGFDGDQFDANLTASIERFSQARLKHARDVLELARAGGVSGYPD